VGNLNGRGLTGTWLNDGTFSLCAGALKRIRQVGVMAVWLLQRAFHRLPMHVSMAIYFDPLLAINFDPLRVV